MLASVMFCVDRHLDRQPVRLAVFRQVGDAVADRVAAASGSTASAPCSVIVPASTGSAPKMARATSVRPAPIRPAKPRISPRRSVEARRRRTRRCGAGRRTCSIDLVASASRFASGNFSSSERPTIMRDDLVDRGRGEIVGRDVAAVAQHRDAVDDLGQSRRAGARCRRCPTPDALELVDDLEQMPRLLLGQRRGRLVHDQHFGIAATAPWRSPPSAAAPPKAPRTSASG